MEGKQAACLSFAVFAILLGFALPVGACLLWGWLCMPELNNRIGTETLVIVMTLVVLSFLCSVLYRAKPSAEVWVDRIMYGCGIVLMFNVAYLIYWTGGMQNSVFAFTLIFFPSAIAIAFEGGWKGLTITALIGAGGAIVTTYYHAPFNWSGDDLEDYRKLFCLFLVLQFALVVALEVLTPVLQSWHKDKAP